MTHPFIEYITKNKEDVNLSISNLENLNDICTCHGHVHILHLLISFLQLTKKTTSIDYLEIGTFEGCSMSVCLQHKCQINATAIDCFELSGHKASYELALKNINSYKKEKDSVTLIKGFSNDDQIIKQVSGKKYDLIFIDGDHATESVISDFKNYFPLVNKKGIMVFDDYVSIEPVKVAVDKICNSEQKENFEIIGSIDNLLPNKCSRPDSAFKVRKTKFDNGKMKKNNEFIIQKK